MENILRLLSGLFATVELPNGSDHDQFVAAAASGLQSDWLYVQIDGKGRQDVPGFESVGYDPGVFRCPWIDRDIEPDAFSDYLIDRMYRRSEIAMDGGWTLVVQSDA